MESIIRFFVIQLSVIEAAINIEEKFENGEDPIPYSITEVFDRAQHALDRVNDPFWGFDELPEGDQEAFNQLFDELMMRTSVIEHDLSGQHRRR